MNRRRTNRPNGVVKIDNEYQKQISREVYEKIPKAVFAAIAVSFMTNHAGIKFEELNSALMGEWRVLKANGIVPQKPPNQ